MYVCICKGITEEMVKKAVNRGYKGKELLKSLGMGDDCGTCLLDAADKYINSGRQKKNSKK